MKHIDPLQRELLSQVHNTLKAWLHLPGWQYIYKAFLDILLVITATSSSASPSASSSYTEAEDLVQPTACLIFSTGFGKGFSTGSTMTQTLPSLGGGTK